MRTLAQIYSDSDHVPTDTDLGPHDMTTPTDAELIEWLNQQAHDYQAYNSKETVAFSNRLFAAADRLTALSAEVGEIERQKLAAYERAECLSEEVERLREALEELLSFQNGCPLPTYDPPYVPEGTGYTATVTKCYDLLENADGK